jgi:hypothetical protein
MKTDNYLKILHIISWILFIGVSIEAGGFLFNALFTIWLKPIAAQKFWTEVNLSDLYSYSTNHFLVLTSFMIIVAVLRAVLFFYILKVFQKDKLDISRPFNKSLGLFLHKLAFLSLGIGVFSFCGAKFASVLASEGIRLPEIQYLRLAGADVWLFMGVTVLVIAQIFKKGIEIQKDNDLTI